MEEIKAFKYLYSDVLKEHSNIFDSNSPHRLSLNVSNGIIGYEDLLEMW